MNKFLLFLIFSALWTRCAHAATTMPPTLEVIAKNAAYIGIVQVERMNSQNPNESAFAIKLTDRVVGRGGEDGQSYMVCDSVTLSPLEDIKIYFAFVKEFRQVKPDLCCAALYQNEHAFVAIERQNEGNDEDDYFLIGEPGVLLPVSRVEKNKGVFGFVFIASRIYALVKAKTIISDIKGARSN